MPLPSSGSISLNQMHVEVGGTSGTQVSLNDSDIRGLIGKASGAQMSFSEWYGASARVSINLTLSSNTNNYNIQSSRGGSYSAGTTDVTLTIGSGVSVGSTSTGTYALETGNSWSSGDTITVVNNGTIKGRGGNGGTGQSRIEGSTDNASNPPGTPVGNTAPSGNAGGHAFRAQFPVSFTNNGSVYGGGGGGGGAGVLSFPGFKGPASYNGGGGGGGGAGVNAGSGGPGGTGYTGTTVNTGRNGPAGSSGTSTAGGAGGDDAPGAPDFYRAGGSGGGLGANGSTGETGSVSFGFTSLPGGPGGPRGRYQTGSSFINSGSGIGGTVGGGSS